MHNTNEWEYIIKIVEQCYLFWVFLIRELSGMVDVFCSCIYVWGRVEYNIILCCDTILPHKTELVCGVLHIAITEQ